MSYILLVFVAILFAPYKIFALDVLQWQDCVKLAYQHNPVLQAIEYDKKANQYAIKQAYSGFYPTINLSTQVQDSSADAYKYKTTQTYSSMISMDIFAGFKTSYEIMLANKNAQIADLNSQLSEINLIYELRSTFIKALYTKKNMELLQLINKKLEQNTRTIKIRYQGGQEPRWSYLKAQTDLAQSSLELQKVKDDYDMLKNKLAQMIAYEKDFEVVGIIEFTEVNSLHQVCDDISSNVEVKLKNLEASIIPINKKIQQSLYWPQISAFSSYSYSKVEASSFNKQWTIGVDVKLPLFSGFKTYYSIEELNQKIYKQELLNQNFKERKKLEVSEYYNQYVNSLKLVKFYEQSLQAVEERLTTIEKEYQLGLKSFFEWDQTLQLYINAQKILLKSQQEAALAYITLFKACGRIPK